MEVGLADGCALSTSGQQRPSVPGLEVVGT